MKPEGTMRRPAFLIILAGILLFGFGMVTAYHGAGPRESSLTAQGEPDDDGP
jgi:hypothetical protein